MAAVVHHNPGLLDIQACTCFGINAKPNSESPIGMFGTGLKYAIAVLLRHGIKIRLLVGNTEYVFYTSEKSFRGKEFRQCMMKKKGIASVWSYQKLPFTTELGRNWQLWQAYRELHANALDEGGGTCLGGSIDYGLDFASITRFVIDDSRYLEIYNNRHEIFLPPAKEGEIVQTGKIEVRKGRSKHIYYRGLRIMTLKHAAQYTYNFLTTVTLTEDRTAKYPASLEAELAEAISSSEDEEFIEKTAVSPPSDSYERHMYWGGGTGRSAYAPPPSAAFKKQAKKSQVPAVKELWDQCFPTVSSSTKITVTIPLPSISPAALQGLAEAVHAIWQSAEITCPESHLARPVEGPKTTTEQGLADEVAF